MEATHNLADVRRIMSEKDAAGDAIPFSVRFASYDKKRSKKSEVIEIEFAILYRQSYELISLMVMYRDELTKKIIPSGNIRAVHLSLITRINNVEVQWT
jgi:hypothetical protein